MPENVPPIGRKLCEICLPAPDARPIPIAELSRDHVALAFTVPSYIGVATVCLLYTSHNASATTDLLRDAFVWCSVLGYPAVVIAGILLTGNPRCQRGEVWAVVSIAAVYQALATIPLLVMAANPYPKW